MTEATIREIFSKINFLEKENISGQMDGNTMVYGEMENLMIVERIPGLMAEHMRVNITMENDMGMVL